jgi:putative oxidoreductase
MLSIDSSKFKDYAPLLLRIGVGLIFIVAGWGKLNGIEGTAAFFGSLGIPMAGIMAWVVGIVEFVGGIMVLVGFRVQLPALLLATVMLVAILTSKLGADNVFQAMRLDLMLLLSSLTIFILGSGKYSVDDATKK